jgi:hypothetical protein
LAQTSPTSSGRSVGIVRSRTKATKFIYVTEITNWAISCWIYGVESDRYKDVDCKASHFARDTPPVSSEPKNTPKHQAGNNLGVSDEQIASILKAEKYASQKPAEADCWPGSACRTLPLASLFA